MRFEKWQALGNDYTVIERGELPFQLTPARIRRLCDGHFGVFSDGILLLSRSEDPGVVADLAIYNPDGSRAELSGNGSREAILYLRHRGWTDEDSFTISTDAGPISPQITGPDTCRVDIGRASTRSKDYPGGAQDGLGEISAAGRTWAFRHVSIGNPQCAIAVEGLEELEGLHLPEIGPGIEGGEVFPNRSNVSWYTELAPREGDLPARIRARIFERGVGETLSSGTGATGAAVAYALGLREAASARPRAGSAAGGGGAQGAAGGGGAGGGGAQGAAGGEDHLAVSVALDGGELLVEIDLSDLRIHLTGWARPVYAGRLSDEFIKELHETQ